VLLLFDLVPQVNPPRRQRRRARANSLIEVVVCATVFCPILLLIAFVCVETVSAYLIAIDMDSAAHLTARALARAYSLDPSVAKNRSTQQKIFKNIRIPNRVNSNEQIAIVEWDTSPRLRRYAKPTFVKVSVTYLPGAGDPPLPQFPILDPLHIASDFLISSSATFKLD